METTLNLSEVATGEFLSTVWWASTIAWTATLVALRSLPAVVYCLGSRSVGITLKFTAALAFIVISGFALSVDGSGFAEVPYLAGGLVYFFILSYGAHWLGDHPARLPVTEPAIFATCAISCVLIPCVLLPVNEANAIRIFGLELALSMYSYLHEARVGRKQYTRSHALFFLLVNPTLVLPEQGRIISPPGLTGRSVLRFAFGIATLLSSVAVAQSYFLFESRSAVSDLGLVWYTMVFTTQGIALTLLHSGLASVQIAWLRALGWQIPERYHWPFFATSPINFWQRWNTYLGAWLRRYIFTPTTLHLRRKYRAVLPLFTQGAAVIITFFITGLLHDGANYPATYQLTIALTLGFTTVGFVVLIWAALMAAFTRLLKRWRIVIPRATAISMSVVGCVFSWQHLMLMFWIITPAGDGRMNRTLSVLLGLDGIGW